MSATEQEKARRISLICIREGEIDSIKIGQEFELVSETDRSWEIEVEGECYMVSKFTRQVRNCWNPPWFAVSIHPD